jgi:Type IV secretion system pilin
MKKFALILLSVIMFTALVPALNGPAAASDPNITILKELQFDVGDNLNLGGTDQEQTYFGEGKNPIVEFIIRIINFALTVIGSIAVIILIIAGFQMMFSQGNQQKLDEAKDVVKYAVIGLIVTLLSYIIVITIQSIFG